MSFYPKLLNGPHRFSWFEKEKRHINFTTINRKTDARSEFYLNRRWELPQIKIYESSDEGDRTEWRLSLAFLWLSLNIHLYSGKGTFRKWEDESRQWGWYFMDRNSFNLCYGRKRWVFDLPFVSTIFHRQEILTPDRQVAWVRPADTKGRWSEVMDQEHEAKKAQSRTFPYRYIRKNGEVQERTVEVSFHRTYRRYKWTPFCNVATYMDYWFSEPTGEGVDDWKGGVLGSAIKALPGETLEQCVRRLESTVKFGR